MADFWSFFVGRWPTRLFFADFFRQVLCFGASPFVPRLCGGFGRVTFFAWPWLSFFGVSDPVFGRFLVGFGRVFASGGLEAWVWRRNICRPNFSSSALEQIGVIYTRQGATIVLNFVFFGPKRDQGILVFFWFFFRASGGGVRDSSVPRMGF